ncbi:MAG TPA: MFS transporter [Legionellaceae bacterium]|nr:MFS transporter [Legionellaceae bacterium]
MKILKTSLQPYLVVFSAALFFFFEFMQVNSFNALNPGLIHTFHISGAALGELSAVYFYASIIFLFPSGGLIDKYSVRKIIIIGMTTLVACTFCFGMATSVRQIQYIRFIMGISGCLTLTCAVKLAAQWFSSNQLASIVGLIIALAMCGGVLSQAPITLLVDRFGWRNALFLDSLLGMFLLLIILYFVKEKTDFVQKKTENNKSNQSFLQLLIESSKNAQNWLGGIYSLFMNTPILLLGAMWGNLYLTHTQHLNRANAAYVLSMIFIGTFVGAPIIGKISDRLNHRRYPMMFAALLALFTILFIMYGGKFSFMGNIALFFCLGFFTSAQILSYPLIAENNPPFLIASAEGLAQTLVMCGGLMQPLFGYFLEKHWDHLQINHMPIYSASDYQHAIMILPIGFLIAFCAAYCLRQGKSSKTQPT